MAEWRTDRTTECPIDGRAEFDRCRRCEFFRGATAMSGRSMSILCNWPRNGSYVAVRPIPRAFEIAFPADEGH